MTYVSINEYGVLTDDGQRIPYDESNADYREYLEWVALGNSVPYVPFDEPSEEQQFFDNIRLDASMVHGGVDGSFLFNNNGMLGERITTGSGSVVLDQGPLIITPTIDTPTITGNLYVGSTPYQGDANSVLTATGTGVEWNFSSGIGDVVRNITPTITDLALVGGVIADNGYGLPGQVLQAIGTGATGDPYSVRWASNQRGTRNALINGDFAIDQRVRPGDSVTHVSSSVFPNNDDAYTLDRWYILSDGNNRVEVNQETSDLPGEQYDYQQTGCRLRVVNTSASAFKFGIAQIIEQRNCVGLIGKPVTLSFKIKVSSDTKLDNIKAAIVQWTGTADTVTSDIVSTWNAEGTNPTLITNASYVNTPANINAQDSWTAYDGTNAQPFTGTVSSSAKNLIVFIWSDVTDTTAGDFIYITYVQLEAGNVATPYDRLPIDAQLERCLRYTCGIWQTAAYGTFGVGTCTATNKFDTVIHLPVPMRVIPSATYSAGTTFHIYTTAVFAANSIASLQSTRNALTMQAIRTANDLTGGASGLVRDTNTGTFAYVIVSAEL
jgi:hypothetical protein